jgi:hypothetical protein
VTRKAEEERARKYMLMGIDFVLHLLGVDRDGLLGRFVRQEFQTWVSEAISREKKTSRRGRSK